MRIIFLGAPGAGKGTMAKIVYDLYNIPHIATGDIFRQNISERTELGKKAKEYIDKGELVPDDLTIELVKDRLKKDDCKKGFIMDGFPRTIPQAEFFEKELNDMGMKIDVVVNIVVPDEEIIERMSGRRVCLKCGATYHVVNIPPKVEGICDRCGEELIQREDDNKEVVMQRLNTYKEKTQPLIEFYEKKGLLEVLDGSGGYNSTVDRMKNIIEKYKKG